MDITIFYQTFVDFNGTNGYVKIREVQLISQSTYIFHSKFISNYRIAADFFHNFNWIYIDMCNLEGMWNPIRSGKNRANWDSSSYIYPRIVSSANFRVTYIVPLFIWNTLDVINIRKKRLENESYFWPKKKINSNWGTLNLMKKFHL